MPGNALSAEDAEDLAQETLLALWRNGNFRESFAASDRTQVFKIAAVAAKNFFRRALRDRAAQAARPQSLALGSPSEEGLSEEPGGNHALPSSEAAWIGAALREGLSAVETRLEAIDPRLPGVLALHAFVGLPLCRAAAACGISRFALRRLLQRAARDPVIVRWAESTEER